jgi:hypothetical protein
MNKTTSSTSSTASINYNKSNNAVKGIQINLGKSLIASTNLIKRCGKIKSFIFFIQEPQVYKGRINLNRIKLHYHKQIEQRPRAAIGHSSDLDILSIPNLTDKDVCSCLWNKPGDSKPTLIISAYWDGLINSIPEMLTSAINFANNKQYQYILCIDANAHSTLWGSTSDNARGKLFEEFIIENGMEIHNRHNSPTFQTIRAGRTIQSIIDLTITSNLHNSPISNWSTSQSFEGSDHRMIHFSIASPKIKKTSIFDFNNCHWTNFQKELNESAWPELATSWGQEEIETEAQLIHLAITNSLDKHCPKKYTNSRIKIGWWSNELQLLKHKVAVARRLAVNTQLADHIEEHSTLQKQYKKLIRSSKRKVWKEKCSNTTNFKEVAKINKMLQSNSKDNHLALLRKPDGSTTENIDEMADILLNTHFPNNSAQELPQTQVTSKAIAPHYPWINTEKFNKAVQLFKNDKAAGPDLIKPIVLKQLPKKVIERICTLYAACIETGYTPKAWRHAKVIFIPKPGKDDYSDPKCI